MSATPIPVEITRERVLSLVSYSMLSRSILPVLQARCTWLLRRSDRPRAQPHDARRSAAANALRFRLLHEAGTDRDVEATSISICMMARLRAS
jgi:hypothetical protein